MTKLPTMYFAVVLFVSGTGHAFAVQLDRAEMAQAAVKKMAQETVECAAYFDIVSLALFHSNDNGTAQEYLEARKKAVERADSLSEGIVNTRYNIAIREMINKVVIGNVAKRIDENLSNLLITDISVLGDQYARLCKEVLSDPGARAKYWMERVGTPQ
jgi:hypothetical protein